MKYFQYLSASIEQLTASSLELFSMIPAPDFREMMTDSQIYDYIKTRLEPYFGDFKGSDDATVASQHKWLMKFVLESMRYVTKHRSEYSRSLTELPELYKYLPILENPGMAERLYDISLINDAVMQKFASRLENIAEAKYQERVEIPEKFKTFIKNIFSHLFQLKQVYPLSYSVIKIAMVKCHSYKIADIRTAVDQDMPLRQKANMLEDLKGIIPKSSSIDYFASWFEIARIFTFLSLFNMLQDYILDIKLTVDYFNWPVYIQDYDCIYFTKQDYGKWNGTTLEHRNCSFSHVFLNSSLDCMVEKLSSNPFPEICSIDKNPKMYTSSCNVIRTDSLVAFLTSLIILVITQIMQCIVLYVYFDTFEALISYLKGDCCRYKYQFSENQAKKHDKNNTLVYILMFMLALFLPFVTKTFVVLFMSLHIFRSKTNRERCKTLGIENKLGRNEPFRQSAEFKCDVCNDCTSKQCVCTSCGHLNTHHNQETNNKKIDEETLFNHEINALESNISALDRLDRLVTGAIENTYMPLIQMYFLLPLIISAANTVPETDEARLSFSGASLYTKLILHAISIASSLIGLSSTAMDLHFKRGSKICLAFQTRKRR